MNRWTGSPGRSVAAGTTRRSGGGGRTPLQLSGDRGVFVVHRAGAVPPPLAEAAQSLRGAGHGPTTVLVGSGLDDVDALCERLAPLLEECRESGSALLRLVMSEGAADRPDRPAPARTICESWGIDVLAPGGRAFVVPGGTLFAPDRPDSSGGWWHFSPGLIPQRVGTRYPEPRWQGALERVTPDTADGHLVEPVPGGLLLRPVEAGTAVTESVHYTVPADPAGPVILVGAPDAPPVPADALASLVAALPAQIRNAIRLVPGDGRDLLATGQEVADELGMDVQVLNGVPAVVEHGDARGASTQVVLMDAQSMPTWQPYLEAFTCLPSDGKTARAPRVTRWRPPVPGLEAGKEPGVHHLDRRWQVTVTRAGLWVGPRGSRASQIPESPADNDVMAIDLGLPGQKLDDSLWAALERLFGALEDAVRDRTVIQVHGECGAEEMRFLRRLVVRHGLALAPKRRLGAGAGTPSAVVPTRVAAPPAAPAPAAAHVPAPAPATASRQAPAAAEATAAPARVAAPAAAAPLVVPPARPTATHTDAPAAAIRPIARTPQEPAAADASGWMTAGHPVASSASAAGHNATAPVAGGTAPPRGGTAEASPAARKVPSVTPPPAASRPISEPTTPPVEQIPATSAEPTGLAAPTGPTAAADTMAATDPTAALGPALPVRSETGYPGPPRPSTDGTYVPTGFSPSGPDAGAPGAPERTHLAPDTGQDDQGRQPVPRSGPPVPAAPVAGHPSSPEPAAGPRGVTSIPVRPSHRSSPADREALRILLGTRWDQYAGAVSRALTRMPGLRNDVDADALTADLVAVRSYLSDEQGLLDHRRLGEQLALGQTDALPFVSCVASGLRRLPSYRGAAVRSAGVLRGSAGQLLPGAELGEAAPVSAVILDKECPSAPADHYVIWSATGRRPGSLADSRTGTGHEEVLFGPGTRFRVLQVREQAGTTVVLLRELAETAPQAVPGRLDDSDAAVLTRLLTAAGQPTLPSAGQGWPDRCAGTLGTLVPESG